MAAYTHNKVDTSRNVINSVAKGSFDAKQYTVRTEAGKDFVFKKTTISPYLMGHWTHYKPDSYTEAGVGGAGLRVIQEKVDIVELGIGLDVNWLLRSPVGSYFMPEVSVGYRHDFADDNVQMTSNFIDGGAAFTTQGADPQQNTFNAGFGFTYYNTENWEMSAEYNFEYKEDFDAHAGMAKAAYHF